MVNNHAKKKKKNAYDKFVDKVNNIDTIGIVKKKIIMWRLLK